jgi:hypothetical protein
MGFLKRSGSVTSGHLAQWAGTRLLSDSGYAASNLLFKRGSGYVTFSNTPGYVDVNTGLASVSGCVCTLHYDMGDGVVVTNHINYPSAGYVRIYARNVTGTGTLGLDVWWIAW